MKLVNRAELELVEPSVWNKVRLEIWNRPQAVLIYSSYLSKYTPDFLDVVLSRIQSFPYSPTQHFMGIIPKKLTGFHGATLSLSYS